LNPTSSSGESAANSIFEIPGLLTAIWPPNRRAIETIRAAMRSARMANRPFRTPPTRPFEEAAPARIRKSFSWRRVGMPQALVSLPRRRSRDHQRRRSCLSGRARRGSEQPAEACTAGTYHPDDPCADALQTGLVLADRALSGRPALKCVIADKVGGRGQAVR
jgi:hypothetical protein